MPNAQAVVLRLGVFGGAFDPPHRAHVALVETAIAQLRLDRVQDKLHARPAVESAQKRGRAGKRGGGGVWYLPDSTLSETPLTTPARAAPERDTPSPLPPRSTSVPAFSRTSSSRIPGTQSAQDREEDEEV